MTARPESRGSTTADGAPHGRFGLKLFDSAQMRAADAAAIASGISGGTLMAAAGAAVAARLTDLFPACTHVMVLCGRGNNGGDGYVAARLLGLAGLDVQVLELAQPTTVDASAARGALIETGSLPAPLTPVSLATWLDDPARTRPVAGADDTAVHRRVIVDAILGCGLDRAVEGALAEVVDRVNASGLPVLAVDVPTGVAADMPVPPGPHVRATATIQLAGPKLASAFQPARAAYATSGSPELDVADIGIPAAVLDALSDVTLLTSETCRPWLPRREPWAHKYSAGTVTVVAGSAAYAGAAELACRGAWRGGAGLVTLAGNHRHPGAWPETVYRPLEDEWPPEGLDSKAAAACVIGPGLAEESLAVVPRVLSWAPGPVVIDASALSPAVLWPALEAQRAATGTPRVVLTPHAGEAARLLDTTVAEVNARPLRAAARLSERSGAIVVLKGPTSVIAAPDGRLAVSTRGHPGMASGGTGDVLAGLIGALTAARDGSVAPPTGQGVEGRGDTFERACLAVFVHGIAGERAAQAHGNSLLASDLVDQVAGVLVDLADG